ncbi:helix-turn-helix transcriptional regulator [Streptomyces sp. WMMC1477]|uniref:helix-turn-helix transcriptional regulator n=1 Tax=Streptomyces sp. WMMC1477 TaxID=3015155 RepID=UPI0022B667BA|nr:helix-turn-helix transcriptional regulator [Streptomyces sp. WMMC1477]MCZ7431358.1 helix-turn-helix transcriptional regulator [Streptomyces sp. WMMC1477]
MDRRAELGAFLRSRRARLKPEDVGLSGFGGRRRVPGLRREELAQTAGVSVDYYVRFEQGRGENVSDSVIDAVATALRLTTAERAHLHDLARAVGGRPGAARTAPPEVREGVRSLLAALTEVPAYVVGRRTDILAWNGLYAELLTDLAALPADRRNTALLTFLDTEVRARYVDWETKARNVVAYLRMDHGRHPGDPAFDTLIEELSDGSADFCRMWAAREVDERTHGTYRMLHPAVGELTVRYEGFRPAGDPETTLIAYTAQPGSPSEAALQRLARRAARRRDAAHRAAGPGGPALRDAPDEADEAAPVG